MSGLKPMSAYAVVHYLLRQHQGPASDRRCVECDRMARHWAYDHEDVFERLDVSTTPPLIFSVNFDHYQPMCQPCHWRLDNANRARVAALIAELSLAS